MRTLRASLGAVNANPRSVGGEPRTSGKSREPVVGDVDPPRNPGVTAVGLRTRSHVDYANAVPAFGLAQRFAKRPDAEFRSRVGYGDRAGLAIADRADVDNGAGLSTRHILDYHLRAAEHAL